MAVPFLPVTDLSTLAPDLRDRMLAVQEKAGFIPSVFLMLARRPEEFRAFFAYHDALMERRSAMLGRAEREMIVVATSAHNHCLYCVVAHGAILRIVTKDASIAEKIVTNWRKAGLSAAQLALLEFTTLLARDSASAELPRLSENLREQGYTDDDIWDAVSITSFFAMSNRLANGLGIDPNAQFYAMGRDFAPQT